MKALIVCLIIFISLPLQKGFSEETFSFLPQPSWVNELPIPEIPKENDKNFLRHYLLYNKQICVESGERFTQLVFHLPNQQSVQDSSQIEISFDPSYETVTLHELSIYRNGTKIDKKETSHIQTLQREVDLESYLLNGIQSLVILVDDVRTGDIISCSYTIKGANPVYQDHFFLTHFFGSGYPIERNYLRICTPKDKELFIKTHKDDQLPKRKIIEGEYAEWIFDGKPSAPILFRESTPSWFIQSPYIEITDFKNWGEVANLFSPYYQVPEIISNKAKIQELAEQTTHNSTSKEDQALKLLQLVQKEVRYFGIETSVNAFYPASPEEVLEKRQGDCKGKVILLSALLKEVGIESTPYLVSTSVKEHLIDQLPSPSLFNHVILGISIDGKTYFVDPTLPLQGGPLNTLYLPYAYGLPLSQDKQTLISLPPHTPLGGSLDIEIVYNVKEEGKLLAKITTTCQGGEADYWRNRFATEGKSLILESGRSSVAKVFGEVLDSHIDSEDLFEKNEFVFHETYTIQRDSEEDPIQLCPLVLDFYLPKQVDLQREAPLFQYHPVTIKEKITLHTPTPFENLKDKDSFDHPWGSFSYTVESGKNTFTINTEYQSKKDHILPEELPAFRAYIKSLNNKIPHQITIENSSPAESPGLGFLASIISMAIVFVLGIAIKKSIDRKRNNY